MTNTTLYTSEYFLIEGGKPLRGTVSISGSKNASLPIIIASLLTDQECRIKRVPKLLDVETTVHLLTHLGASVEREGDLVKVDPSGVCRQDAPDEIVRKMRASVLVMGPLLARFGRALVSMPGGCAIGVRSIDQHLKVFERAGASIRVKHGYLDMELKKIKPVEYTFEVIT
ncbi:MAG: UDP-N-acetylglucosamine 1-carboxyvinyltransferase, partial [Aquificota bacterium]